MSGVRVRGVLIVSGFIVGSLWAGALCKEKWIMLQTGSTGFPGGALSPLLIDRQGLLWIGGGGGHVDAGIAVYDGSSLLNITNLYGEILRGYGVKDFARDSTGGLWVQTQPGYPHSGALIRFDLAAGSVCNTGYEAPFALRLMADADGVLYAGDWYGLSRLENDTWIRVPIQGFDTTTVVDIQFDMNRDMWLLSNDGLFHRQGEDFTYIPPPVSFKYVTSFKTDFDNNLWIINQREDESYQFHSQLLLYRSGAWTILSSENSALPDVRFTGLSVDTTNTLWLTTLRGAYMLNTETLEVTTVEGLQSYSLSAIVIDNENRKWIGTANGDLIRCDDENIIIIEGKSSGLQSDEITKIKKDRNGLMWIGSRKGGLAVADGFDMTPYSIPNSVYAKGPLSIEALAVDSVNAVWFGLVEEQIEQWWWPRIAVGLFQTYDYSYTYFSSDNSALPDEEINDILVSGDNVKFVSTKRGLAAYNDLTWRVTTSFNSGLQGDNTKAVAIDSAGLLWIASEKGLNRFDGVNWLCYNTGNSPLPDAPVTALAVDERNRLWIGTTRGLAVLANGEWSLYTMENSSLPGREIAGFEFSRPANKWIIVRSYIPYGVYHSGGGLVHIDENDRWQVVSHMNLNPEDAEYDGHGNLWISANTFFHGMDNPASEGGIYIYNPNGVDVPLVGALRGQIFPLQPDYPKIPDAGAALRIEPNPCMGTARILYKVETAGSASFIIYDILGRQVYHGRNETRSPGTYSTEWPGTSDNGIKVSSGIYICQMTINHSIYRQKLTLLR